MKKILAPLILITFFPFCADGQSSHSKTIAKTLQTEIDQIKFDETITRFKFATMLANKFLYSPQGKKDLAIVKPTSGYFIMTVPNMDYEASRDYLQSLNENHRKQATVDKVEGFKIKIYNTPAGKAIMTTFNIIYKSRAQSVAVQAIVSNGKNAILFVGEDYKGGIYLDQFKKTFESIEK